MDTRQYQEACKNLLREISQYSPDTEAFLNQMVERTGAEIAYYAAFIIVCLEARVQQVGYRAVEHVDSNDLRLYTFFEFGDMEDEAHELFRKSLECYQSDCQRRFARVNTIPYSPAAQQPAPGQ